MFRLTEHALLCLTERIHALLDRFAIPVKRDPLYQGAAFDRDVGMRIDHVLLSPTLAERLKRVEICRAERAAEQPSDHVPVLVDLD